MARRRERGSWSRACRWTEGEALEVLAALEESGESVSAFARHEGLSAGRLYRWRARLQLSGRPAFVEVSRPEVEVERGEGRLEVVVASGRVVRVPTGFDVETLRRLLVVLEEDAC